MTARHLRTPRPLLGVLLSAVVLGACSGTIGDFGDPGMADADGDGSRQEEAGDPKGGSLPRFNSTKLDRSSPCNVASVDASPLRRLSHVEYGRTVQDLFPDLRLGAVDLAAEERIHGFENNVRAMSPSAIIVEQRFDLAAEVAAKVAASERHRLATLDCDPAEGMNCVEHFIETFGARAFRRPLTADEMTRYLQFFEEKADAIDFEGAFQLTLQAMLQSPHLLYRLEFGQADGAASDALPLSAWELATRLSYTLWQTMPDDELLRLAETGELLDEAVYAEQVERMLADDRAAKAFADFHRQWLELEELEQQSKDSKQFPGWSGKVREALAEESTRFLELLYREGEATQQSLLTSRRAELSPELADLYGVDVPGDEWAEVELPAEERAGILTRGAFLALHARPTNGSPPLRGVAVLEQLLCAAPPEPPPNVDITIPENDPDAPMTNRQLFESRTSVAACQGCHESIDGIGMAFEHYDATGQFRDTDAGQPVDATGELVGTDADVAYDDAVGMSEALAGSRQVTACLMVNWYRYTQGRDEASHDWCRVDALEEAVVNSDGDLTAALRAVVTSFEFRHRTPIER